MFPTGDELAETTSVMRMLGVLAARIPIAEIAKSYKRDARLKARCSTILALARLGQIASPDRGTTSHCCWGLIRLRQGRPPLGIEIVKFTP